MPSDVASPLSPARALRVLEPVHGPAGGGLVERTAELDALEVALRRLSAGTGGVVTVEAPAGFGKTALLDEAERLAAGTGTRVRRAAPGPLERGYDLGVVRALLEAPLREASDGERARLLDGPAAAAGELLLTGAAPAGEPSAVAHGVLWLCGALARTDGLALVVDDLQWADRASLRILAYLARRAPELRVLLVVAWRAQDPEAPADLLALLGDDDAAARLYPAPLSSRGAARLLRSLAGDLSDQTCRRAHEQTRGDPWLLGAVGRRYAADRDAAPAPAGRRRPLDPATRVVVRRRLAALGPAERAVADALSVLGEHATPALVATLADVEPVALSRAQDALAAAGLLAPDRARLAHRLVAAAIGADLAPSEHDRLHRQAARALVAAGSRSELAAAHALRCAPRGDPGLSRTLARAAREATGRGAPEIAVAYLRRALEERAPGDDRGPLLAHLATASFDAGLPGPGPLLHEALDAAVEPAERVEVLGRLAALEAVTASNPGLPALVDLELAGPAGDPETRLALEAVALDSLLAVPERQDERARRARAGRLEAAADQAVGRVGLAHRAWLAAERGTPDAAACADLARRALEGDRLLAQAGCRSGFHLCVRALILSDRVEETRHVVAQLGRLAAARGSRRLTAAAAWYAAELALRTGHVARAERGAAAALASGARELDLFGLGLVMTLVVARAERGDVDGGAAVLRDHGLDGTLGARPADAGVLHARARLALAAGDFSRALDEAREAGRQRDAQGRPNPSWTPWRSAAALALAHLGRRDEAVGLADVELALAEAFGAPVAVVTALHARAVAEPDAAARVAWCHRALAASAEAPGVLGAARVRLELGSALRSLGRRVEARDALRTALADADAMGADALAQHAHRELVATGLRPRRRQFEGAAALTPRQREVCELAAAGRSNRAIAHALFLSVKTVETHLAASYRKLGVDTRAALEAVLAAGDEERAAA